MKRARAGTMSMTETSQKDRFWQRIRMLLGAGPGGRQALGRAEPARRLSSARPLDEELQRGWMLCAERRVSLCVMALEVDCFPEYLAAYGRDASEDCLDRIEAVIVGQLKREGDTCLRMGQSGFLLVLPDMPMLMGRDLALRIAQAVRRAGLANKESHAGAVTLGAGLAVVNPEPPFDRIALDMARQALRKAQRRGLSRLDIADLRVADERRSVAA
ncbi:hypothetical protein DMC47_10215 [Nostoc sp. 3335mG]|nr:hypothetical protein DMC47_10215 [Nostoc sp. 3335mG]